MSTTQNQQLTVADTLRKMEPQFKLALPDHIKTERFTRIAVSAVNSNPDILKGDVDQRSVMNACMKAAQDGLVIDGREAALVVFYTKNGKQAQYMPMVAGILKKMRNSGDIANISYGLVYREEWKQGKFEYIKGDNESLRHEPILFEEKGEMIGVYSVVTLKDGSKVREFMDMKQIEKVRNVSRSKDKGPWVDWFDEMAVKSVLRKVAKLCPSSADLDGIFKSDDEDEPAESFNPVTGEVAEQQPRRRQSAADRVKSTVSQNEPENVTPSNVIDADIIDETDDEDLPI